MHASRERVNVNEAFTILPSLGYNTFFQFSLFFSPIRSMKND